MLAWASTESIRKGKHKHLPETQLIEYINVGAVLTCGVEKQKKSIGSEQPIALPHERTPMDSRKNWRYFLRTLFHTGMRGQAISAISLKLICAVSVFSQNHHLFLFGCRRHENFDNFDSGQRLLLFGSWKNCHVSENLKI